jgi:hypothetical protein
MVKDAELTEHANPGEASVYVLHRSPDRSPDRSQA